MPARRRRAPLVAALVAVGLMSLLVAAEFAARALVTTAVRERVAAALDTSPDEVAAEVGGASVLLQLARGELDDVSLASEQLALDGVPVSGRAWLSGVPLRGSGALERADARLELDAAAVEEIVLARAGGAVESVTLSSGEIVLGASLELLGARVPLEVGILPTLDAGALVLEPASVRIAGVGADVAALQERFGVRLADVVPTLRLCLAEHLPAEVVLDDVRVTGEAVVLTASARALPLAALESGARGGCG